MVFWKDVERPVETCGPSTSDSQSLPCLIVLVAKVRIRVLITSQRKEIIHQLHPQPIMHPQPKYYSRRELSFSRTDDETKVNACNTLHMKQHVEKASPAAASYLNSITP